MNQAADALGPTRVGENLWCDMAAVISNSVRYFAWILCLVVGLAPASAADGKVRLFVLSGQSNMAGINPHVSFTPEVEKEFVGDEVIVVKFAAVGQPIRRWYKKWQLPAGATDVEQTTENGDLYDQMMQAVVKALGEKKPESVAFVWMQGERDANNGWQAVYYQSLHGLVEQLRADLNRPDMVVVIGRLSDHLNGNVGWDAVRAAQEKIAADEPLSAWVDTDDLNDVDGRNDLHYTKDGYAELGRRFAASAIELIRKHEAAPASLPAEAHR